MTKGDEKEIVLPIRRFAEDIIAAVRANDSAVVIGETGSGKTTQLSQILLEAKFAETGQIAVTQPRRVGAVTVAKRVAEERGVELGTEVGYAVRFEDRSTPDTKIKYLTDGTLLRECLEDNLLQKYSVIILDEAHERSLNTDILFGVLKRLLRRRKQQSDMPLKLIITSATLDGEKFSTYFNDCPVFNVPGRCFPVDIIYAMEDHFKDHVSAAVDTALQIHLQQPPGDILVFLTGQAEIKKAIQRINTEISGMPGDSCGPLLALPLHASLPPEMQVRVFRAPPEGTRRVIVSTNVAETSVTVEGVVYVVDTGVVKQKHYQPATGMDSLDVVPISRVGATQRAGRAGRTRPGKCFRLYTKAFYEGQMPIITLPEIQRTSLVSAVLYLKSLELEDMDVLSFDFLDAPGQDALEEALRQLYCLDAIDADGVITDMGRRMAGLPVDPALSRALIEAEKLGCVSEVISVSAMLATEHVFSAGQGPGDVLRGGRARNGGMPSSSSTGRGEGPKERLRELVRRAEGDHVLLLRLWEAWRDRGYSRDAAHEFGLDLRGMNFAKEIRRQLEGVVKEVRLHGAGKRPREDEDVLEGRWRKLSDDVDGTLSMSPRQRAEDARRIEATCHALTVGFVNKLARRLPRHNGYKTVGSTKGQLAQLHPSCSGLPEDDDGLTPEWVIYHELVSTSKPFLRQVCPTRPEYVSPLVAKMASINVLRLSRGRIREVRSGGDHPSKTNALDPEHKSSGAGGVEAASATKRNTDDAVKAARERYLNRKKESSSASGAVHNNHGRK